MFWVSKVLAPAVLVLGIAGTAAVMATPDGQPPFGKGFPGRGDDKKKDDKKADDKKSDDKKGAGDKKAAAPAKPDAVVEAWLKTLLEKITDPHDTVRDSARGAIVGVGPAAIPALQKLADGDDPAKAVAARKLINAITRGGPGGQGGQPGPGGRPSGMGPGGAGFPGMPGMGPMGPGGRGGPGGFPGMGPGGRGGFGGWGGFGPRRPDRKEESEIEVAPMPRRAR